MKNDIILEPESEQQREFIDALAAARNFGVEETDLSKEELAIVFNQFAIGLLLQDSQASSGKSVECPECGQVLSDVEIPGIGMDPVGVPCGCELERSQVPQELVE